MSTQLWTSIFEHRCFAFAVVAWLASYEYAKLECTSSVHMAYNWVCIYACTHTRRHAGGRHGGVDSWIDGMTDGWLAGWVGGWMDGWM